LFTRIAIIFVETVVGWTPVLPQMCSLSMWQHSTRGLAQTIHDTGSSWYVVVLI